MKEKILVGAHMSIAKHMHLAFTRGESIGCTAMQIFTKNSRTLFAQDIAEDELVAFSKKTQTSSIECVVAHAGYLINLCAKNESVEKKSIDSLIHELNRCAQLGITHLVFHPGAHVGAGVEAGLEKIIININQILEKTAPETMLVIETMAGQGTTLASTFEQIQTIYQQCTCKKRLAVCLDTCHIFAAGYDVRTIESYHHVIQHFDDTIGLDRLAVIHLNDSFGDYNSHVDRHAPLGKGKIPMDIFKKIMQDKRFSHIPKILETPTDASMVSWKEEIELLKQFGA